MHPRTRRIFNIDVYLDASRIGEGALRVAPGSHLAPVDVCQLQEEYGWDAPGVVQVELDPGPWDAEWVDRRLRLLPVALREHARRNPGAEPFAWNVPSTLAPRVTEDDDTELRIAHGVHSPGSYCSAGSVPFSEGTAVTE